MDSSSLVQEPEPVIELGIDPTRDSRRDVRVAWEKLPLVKRSKSNPDVF
jgi:hypothetical protein